MKIAFYELPPQLRVGGLETAVRGLEAALADYPREARAESRGLVEPLTVLRDPAPQDLEPGDVAHFHGLWSIEHWRVSRELRRRGIPYVTSPHGMLEPWAIREKRWKKLPYLKVVEGPKLLGGRILATAEQEAERLRKRLGPRADVHVISLGTDMRIAPDYDAARAKLGWAPNERVLLYLSRIHKKKGLLQLLQTLARLVESEGREVLRDARLVIVGDGDATYVSACKEAAKSLEGHLRIDWREPVWSDEKWLFLQGADLMCLPTFSENFGMVVLEACQVGTPVLTTIETPWKIIADAGLGYVGPATMDFYEDALRDFFRGGRQIDRPTLARWARDRFEWSALVREYLNLYERLRQER